MADNYIQKYKNLKFLTAEETLDYIIDKQMSLARFSDGEIGLLTGAGIFPPDSDWSQCYSAELKKRLEEVLVNDNKNLLIAHETPEVFLRPFSGEEKKGFIYNMWIDTKVILYKYLKPGVTYGHAHLFVPFHNHNINWKKIRDFLASKDVVVVTGGIEKISDIKLGKRTFFVEAGKKDVFEKYDSVKNDLLTLFNDNKLKKDNSLIMVSLGPTADILAFDLSKEGFLVWDTGHIFRFSYKELKKLYG